MVTKQMIESRLKELDIKCNIIDFKELPNDNMVWFAFSFEEGHVRMDDQIHGILNLATEDDAITGYHHNDRDDLEEAIDCIMYSKLSPYYDKTCKDCKKFTGSGDWNLCCMEKHEGYPYGFLCYEYTRVCEKFVAKEQHEVSE